MADDLAGIQPLLEMAGQSRLVDHVRGLDADSQARFIAELNQVDFETLRIQRQLVQQAETDTAVELAPAPSITKGADEESDAEAEALGNSLLDDGRVGVFVVAGGQGSRLGYDGPKGCYPATPITGATLFQLFAGKILAMGRRHGCALPWYIMVSQTNEQATRKYFAEQENFGLDADDVFFVCQDMLPALDADGEILLAEPDQIFWSPNGHGGSLLALETGGALEDMRQRGIEQLFYFQVDNPLAQIADPVFLGYHAAAGAGMSTKVVPKRDAGEKVGVVGLVGGNHGVIEYSDLTPAELAATDESGQLRFNDGNIAVHFLERAFIERVAREDALPFHLARKVVESVDPQTGARRQDVGIKFETFIFDALRETPASVVLSVDRSAEFAPIKNAEGEDSPRTSQSAQTEQFASWLQECGVEIPRDAEGRSIHPIEIAPCFALDADELLTKDLADLSVVDQPLVLDS